MRIKNLWASATYKGVFAILIAVALALDFGFFRGEANFYILNYYTVLSNIACLVFFAVAHFRVEKALKAGAKEFVWWPRGEAAVVFCISVTGIVYATMLAPIDIASGNFFTFNNLMLHYIGPVMVLVDWLLFCPKGRLRATDPLLWLLIPLAYFGYIVVRATFAGDIGDSGSRFPYGFIDPAVQGGWGGVMRMVGLLTVGMAALGYVIYLIDHYLPQLSRSRER